MATLTNFLLFLLAWQLDSPSTMGLCDASCQPSNGIFNASGSVSVPYPQPPISGSPNTPSGNYTLSTYLFDGQNNAGSINQSFAATNSKGEAIVSEKFAYQGCMLSLLFTSPAPTTKGHINNATVASCESALSSTCISSILNYINTTALGLSQNPDSGTGSVCSHFNTFDITIGCDKNKWGGSISAAIFQTNPIVPAATEGSNCSKAADTNPTGVLMSTEFSTSGAMYSSYYQSVTPIIITAWNNASSNGGIAWADTRLFCITPNKLAAGDVQGHGGASWTSRVWSNWELITLLCAAVAVGSYFG